MIQHYITVWKRAFDFQGRSRRQEFWYFTLANVIISVLTTLIDMVAFPDVEAGVIGLIYSLAVLIPQISVSVRRLHDIGKSGWWYLLWFAIIIGWIILIIWHCRDSAPRNRFGPNPKELDHEKVEEVFS